MNTQENKIIIDYHRFTICRDKPIKVARRDDSSVAFFCFNDDVWDLINIVRPHERNCEARLSFSRVAPWLREDAKLYIAHLWLRALPSAIILQQIMVAIRDLGRLLPDFKGRPIDLRAGHARKFSRNYSQQRLKPGSFQRTRRLLNRFITFVRQQHPEVTNNDFVVRFPKDQTWMRQHRPLEQLQEARIEREVFAGIIDACIADTQAYFGSLATYIDPVENWKEYQKHYDSERYKRLKQGLPPKLGNRPRQVQLLSRAIKAQATILAACVGRRPSAICNTRFDVKTEVIEWVNETGGREMGVLVRFRETKVRNLDEDVFCPGIYGELALKAIETAKKLTADLRRHNLEWKDYLFLVPGKQRKKAFVISPGKINDYINGQGPNHKGLIQRFNLPVDKVLTHNFRHTRATNLWLGGLQVHEVAYDLGHLSAEMAIRHYIAGNEESRHRLQFLMDHKALSGVLEDFVGGREMVEARLGRRHVEIMRNQGRIISPTRYGYCCLPAASGPCTRTTPCYIGPGANGGGCDYHILSPDALDALQEDREVLEANIETYSREPEYSAWVDNQKNQLLVVERTMERALDLQRKVKNCDAAGGACSCGA